MSANKHSQTSAQEWVWGLHAVEALLRSGKAQVSEALLQQGRDDARMAVILDLLSQQPLATTEITRAEFDHRFPDARHQGVAIRCKLPQWNENDLDDILDNLQEPPFLLILDGVQDPHNLGACLRTANAAGVHAVIAPRDKSVSMTSVARKVACGAAELTPFIQVTNLVRTLKLLQDRGIWLTGTDDEESQSLYKANLKGATALVFGAEGKGMRRLTKECCDQLVSIPMSGGVSSLNVSVAVGVCLYEAQRQRQEP